MRSRPVYAELSLRGEIENVLQRDERDYERGRLVPSSWTSRELATELDADRYAVRSELIALKQEGRVIVNGLMGWRWQRA